MNPATAYIFRSPENLPGLFDTLFGGVFMAKGIPLVLQLAILLLYPLAGLCLVAEAKYDKRAGRLAEICALVAFTAVVCFLLTPWDELFINLRHSLNLAEAGTFSFNRLTRLEGTVEFLPYFTIGMLAKLGWPIVEMAFGLSFFGALLCLFAGRSLVARWGFPQWQARAVVLLTLYAPLAFNASNGFSSAPFTGVALWGIAGLFFSQRPAIGAALLSVLPLIRIEGGLLVALLYLYFCWSRRRPRALIFLPLLFAPAAALSLWRLWYFGSPVPLPIQFKSSVGSLFFLLVGIRNFFADALAACALWAGGVFALAAILVRNRKLTVSPALRRAGGPLGCLLLFVLPYYLSGGDWFPSYWGRYLFPFSLYACLLAASLLGDLLPQLPAADRVPWKAAAAALFFFPVLWPISSYAKWHEGVFSNRRILAKLLDKKTGRGHYRIQHLSQLGNHLARTTRESDVIASSEIATIMYHAHRETLDMLGLVNPEIIRAPLRPPPQILRKFPVESELPFLIFKRIQPGLLAKHNPEYLYTFDFILRDLIEDLPFEEVTDADIFRALGRWNYNLKGLVEPLYGGLGEIERLGYKPIVVLYANAFCSMYFVSKEALPFHLAALAQQGFTGGVRVKQPLVR